MVGRGEGRIGEYRKCILGGGCFEEIKRRVFYWISKRKV